MIEELLCVALARYVGTVRLASIAKRINAEIFIRSAHAPFGRRSPSQCRPPFGPELLAAAAIALLCKLLTHSHAIHP